MTATNYSGNSFILVGGETGQLEPAYLVGGEPMAVHSLQGTCPREWKAALSGQSIRSRNGVPKRFTTEAAALKAAKKALTQ